MQVKTAGRAFIKAYDRFQPATMILHMILPGMVGNELALWLARRKCATCLIIITGYTHDDAG